MPPDEDVGIASSGPSSSVTASTKSKSETEPPSGQTPTTSTPTPAILLNGQETEGHDKEGVMKATMTDVQQAIEQLGQRRGALDDGEGSRAYSFTSTRGGVDTENDTDTDFEMSDADGHSIDEGGQDWHKGARRKLAEKARQAVADAERLEMIGMERSISNRSNVPPIEVELSDESEDDDDDQEHYPTSAASYPRRHSLIPEEDDEDELYPPATTTDHASEYSGNLAVDDDPQTATATQSTFPAAQTHTPPPESEAAASLAHAASVPMPQSPPEAKRTSAPLMDVLSSLPSPAVTSETMAYQQQSKRSSSASASAPTSAAQSSHGLESSVSSAPTTSTLSTSIEKKEKTPPSEWTLEDVVDWLKGKGFDQDVCDKFIGTFLWPY